LRNNTPEFLSQILKIPDGKELEKILPGLINAVKAKDAIKGFLKLHKQAQEIVSNGLKSAEQQLQEDKDNPLPFLMKDPKKKHLKKHPKPPVAPNLKEKCSSDNLSEIFDKPSMNPTTPEEAQKTVEFFRKHANKLQKIYSARLDQGRTDAAKAIQAQMHQLITQLGAIKQKFSIQEALDEAEPTKNSDQ
jgi:hypothetical protein